MLLQIRLGIYSIVKFDDLRSLRKTSSTIYFESEEVFFRRSRLLINCSTNLSVLDNKPLQFLSEVSILHDTNFEHICNLFHSPLQLVKKLCIVVLSSDTSSIFNIADIIKSCSYVQHLSIAAPQFFFRKSIFSDKTLVLHSLRSLCVCIAYCTIVFLEDFIERSPALEVLVSRQSCRLDRDIVLSLFHKLRVNLKVSNNPDYTAYKFVRSITRV